MPPLSPKRRSALRSEAHKLNPIVLIGDKGLTDEVVAEIDRSLEAHELIKVRASTDDRKARDEWLEAICSRLGAHPVQQIGKVFVIYRENPQEEEAPKRRAEPGEKAPRRGSTVSERGASRQRARDDAKRRVRDIQEMRAKGKIPADAKIEDEATRTSRPRSRTPSPLPESAPRRRRPRTSR